MESRSWSACGSLRNLFATLARGQLLPPPRLYRLDPLSRINLFSRTAIKTLLDFGAQCFQFGLAAFLALLEYQIMIYNATICKASYGFRCSAIGRLGPIAPPGCRGASQPCQFRTSQ